MSTHTTHLQSYTGRISGNTAYAPHCTCGWSTNIAYLQPQDAQHAAQRHLTYIEEHQHEH